MFFYTRQGFLACFIFYQETMNTIVIAILKSIFSSILAPFWGWLLNRINPLNNKSVFELEDERDKVESITNKHIIEYKKLVDKINAAKDCGDLDKMNELVVTISSHIRVQLFTSMQKQWRACIVLARKRDGKSKPIRLLQEIYEDVEVILEAYTYLQEICDNNELNQKIEMPTARCMDDISETFRYHYPKSKEDKWLNPILVKFNFLHRDFH